MALGARWRPGDHWFLCASGVRDGRPVGMAKLFFVGVLPDGGKKILLRCFGNFLYVRKSIYSITIWKSGNLEAEEPF